MKHDQSILSRIAKYRLIIFFALVLVIGWLPWYTGGSGVLFFSPAISALIVVALFGGKKELIEFARRIFRWRVRPAWYLFALFAGAIISLAAIAVFSLFGVSSLAFPLFQDNQYLLPAIAIVFLLPIGSAMGEEFGFRGYALGDMQRKFGPLIGTTILGLFFGSWIFPEFLAKGTFQAAMGLSFFPFFVLTELGWSFIMTWVYNKTNESAFLAGYITHAISLNFWVAALLTNTTISQLLNGSIPSVNEGLFIVNCGVTLAAALLILIATRGRLGFTS